MENRHASLDPAVLGQILVWQSTLQAARDEDSLEEMLTHGLRELPGVREVNVCIDGAVKGVEVDCARCHHSALASREDVGALLQGCPCECPIEQERGWSRFPMRTDKCEYGAIFIDLSDANGFTPYKPFAANTANFAALFIESRRHEEGLSKLTDTLEKRVEVRTKELEASEANFRHFFEAMTDIMVVATPEGRVYFTNQAARDKLGYSEDELAAMHVMDWHRPEDRKEAEAIFAAMIRGDRDHCPLPLAAKDGSVIPVETRVWFGKWGGQDCLFGICKDLSAEKEAQQRFERIFRSNPSPMALSSVPERRFVDVNDAFLATTGYTREEIIGKATTEVGLVTDPEAQDAVAKALRAEGRIANRELQVCCKDGTLRDGLFSGEVIRSQGRECFLTVMVDITERKRAEKELRYNLALVTSLLDSIPDLIFFKTLEGVYLGCNAAFARHAGRSQEEIVGKTDYELYDKSTADAFRANDRLMLEQRAPRHNEEWIDYPDGHRVLIDTLKAPLVARDGELVGLLGVSRDITKQRQSEAQLRLQSLVLNQIQDRVTVTDLDGVITYVNDAEVRSLGYSRAELIGVSTEKYGEDPERGATQRQIVEETLEHGEWRGEVVNQTAKGEEVILDCRTQVVLDEEGHRIALAGVATDITERKRMEQQLREREQRLSLALETAHLGYWKWTASTDRVEWFGDHHRLYGIRKEDFEETLDHVQRCVHPDDRQMGIDNIRRAVETHTPFNNTYRVVHPDGAIRWLNSFGHVEYDEQGQPESMFGITRDISEYKFAQQQAEERVAQLTALLNCMQRAVLVEDIERRVLFANQDFCDIFGIPNPEAVLGADCHQAAHAASAFFADPEGFLESIDYCLTAGRPVLNERLEMADGRILERTYAPVNMEGRQFGHLWLYQDKTDQIKAEEALRHSEQRIRAFVSVLPDMLFRFDDEFRFVDCFSNQPEELLIPPEQAIGKKLHTLLPGPLARATEQMITKALASGQMQKYSYSLEAPAGERFFEARMVPVHGKEILAIVRDITDIRRVEQERQEMERRIQHAQKLESLGVLAGGIAHDFNNLLMSILGYADLALDELTPTSPARANIEQIETASRRAADLCAQMLAYSGRGRFIIEPFDVSTLIEEMAHLLKTSISKKVVLNLQVERNLPKIQGDATQVRQIIMNLVINASEAIGERSGVISVSTGACQCQAEDLQEVYFDGNREEGLYIFIEVTDTGCGMDQETLDRLFEPFFTTKFTGRGLGMSAVLGIVRGHKGLLKVSSELGKGTTFRILLPPSADDDSGDSREEASLSGTRAANARILLVEDEESVRALGQTMLKRIGFQVATASDGREALAIYGREKETIDLVMLDLTMPHMDGEETLRELKRIDPDVRIVMASGYSNHEIASRLAGEGLLGFIQKPYTMAQLRGCLYPLFEP